MTPEDVEMQRIEAQGWRQGCVLPVACHAEVAQLPDVETPLEPEDACIVVSQSCDLVHHDAQQEPYAELLIAKRLTGPADPLLRNRRNPRRLHFELAVQGRSVGYEAWAWRRCWLRRVVLARHQPDGERGLPDERALRMILDWLAARYRRVALPSAFQRRLKPVQKKLRTLTAKLTDTSAILIALSSHEELGDTEDYQVRLILTLPQDEFAQVERRSAMEQLHTEMGRLFSQCSGIQLDGDFSKADSEANISLSELRDLFPWEEFDYVSYQDHAAHQAPHSGMR